MVSYYQHLGVVERMRAAFGPFVNPFDKWSRHEVFRFDATKISQLAPVVRQLEEGRELAVMRWGLVPYWFRKDEDEAKKFQGRTFNARGETVWEKASFKHAVRKRRCLVPALSFTEFKGKAGNKAQIRIGPADNEGVLAFGGIWEQWKPPAGEDGVRPEPWLTFSVVTTSPNSVVSPLHHRMPLVLPESAWAAWLDPKTDEAAVRELVVPAPDDLLVVFDQD